jgi:hypothetical protein
MAMCESLALHSPNPADLPVIMAANGGGLVGSQLLRGDDAPLYPRGFRVCVGLVSVALAAAILQHVQYRLSNKRLDRVRRDEEDLQGVVSPPFRYTL